MEIPAEFDTVVLYHHSCPDGLLAAWAVSLTLDNETTIYLKSSRFWECPNLAGKHVIFVDVTYPTNVMLKLLDVVASMVIIDRFGLVDKYEGDFEANSPKEPETPKESNSPTKPRTPPGPETPKEPNSPTKPRTPPESTEPLQNIKLEVHINRNLSCAQIAWDYAKNIICNNLNKFITTHIPAVFSDIPCGATPTNYKNAIVSFLINAKATTYRPWFINVLSDVNLWDPKGYDAEEIINRIRSTGAYSNINSFYLLMYFNEDELDKHTKYLYAAQKNHVNNLKYVARVHLH